MKASACRVYGAANHLFGAETKTKGKKYPIADLELHTWNVTHAEVIP
jgi:hypothetical protein